ncbi:MAG: hypothetical protein J1F35_06455 [Erysipelotrichales bacterium]|nr:hypothetical protein [Erysipelotrichales bacterium]
MTTSIFLIIAIIGYSVFFMFGTFSWLIEPNVSENSIISKMADTSWFVYTMFGSAVFGMLSLITFILLK